MRFVWLMDWFVLNMVGGSMSDYKKNTPKGFTFLKK